VFVLSKKRRRKEESTEHKVRMPMEGEVFGVVVQLLGYDRVRVECEDGYTRVCRIPGKMKKRVWIREGDIVQWLHGIFNLKLEETSHGGTQKTKQDG